MKRHNSSKPIFDDNVKCSSTSCLKEINKKELLEAKRKSRRLQVYLFLVTTCLCLNLAKDWIWQPTETRVELEPNVFCVNEKSFQNFENTPFSLK